MRRVGYNAGVYALVHRQLRALRAGVGEPLECPRTRAEAREPRVRGARSLKNLWFLRDGAISWERNASSTYGRARGALLATAAATAQPDIAFLVLTLRQRLPLRRLRLGMRRLFRI